MQYFSHLGCMALNWRLKTVLFTVFTTLLQILDTEHVCATRLHCVLNYFFKIVIFLFSFFPLLLFYAE